MEDTMKALTIIALLGGVIISLIIVVSITKISDNTTAIRAMIAQEIKRQKEKDKPAELPALPKQ